VILDSTWAKVAGTWLQLPAAPRETVNVLSDAPLIEVDARLGKNYRVTLGGNRTLANPTNAYDWQMLMFEFIQDGSGNRTLTLDTKFKLGTDIAAVTLSTGANKRDLLGVRYNADVDKFDVIAFVRGY
jgi:hypothetical protein